MESQAMDAAMWLPALAALAFGLFAGAVLVTRRRGGDARSAELEMALKDCDERVEHSVAQLKDLERQQPRIDDVFYAAQHAELMARAATALRERDETQQELASLLAGGGPVDRIAPTTHERRAMPAAEATPVVGFFAARPALRGALWGAGTVALVGLLAFTVWNESHPRDEGGSMTGNSAGGAMAGGMAPGGGAAPTTSDPELQALVAKLEQDPSDIVSLLALTKKILRAQMYDEAAELVRRVLALEPKNAEARVYEATLKAARGDAAGAMSQLDEVVREAPQLAEAWFFRGMLGMQSGDQARMRESFEKFVAVAPDGPQKERVRAMLSSAAK